MNLPLRPFGQQVSDLDVDFAGSPPHLITEVLASCHMSRGDGMPDLWALTVSDRLAALLELVACSGEPVLEVRLRCPNVDCAELLELELPVGEVLERHRAACAEEHLTVGVDGAGLVLRRPTGADQAAWLIEASQAPLSLAAVLCRLCVAPEALDEGAASAAAADPRVGEALDQFDPLVHFVVQVRCSVCGTLHTHTLPLQHLALERLRRCQLTVLEDVHRLALHYHWDERQILALPPHRRMRYLALLSHEADR